MFVCGINAGTCTLKLRSYTDTTLTAFVSRQLGKKHRSLTYTLTEKILNKQSLAATTFQHHHDAINLSLEMISILERLEDLPYIDDTADTLPINRLHLCRIRYTIGEWDAVEAE